MNVVIGTVITQFLFWEYFFEIFGIASLQCIDKARRLKSESQFKETDSQDHWVVICLWISKQGCLAWFTFLNKEEE
jgi:hypothetical protein